MEIKSQALDDKLLNIYLTKKLDDPNRSYTSIIVRHYSLSEKYPEKTEDEILRMVADDKKEY